MERASRNGRLVDLPQALKPPCDHSFLEGVLALQFANRPVAADALDFVEKTLGFVRNRNQFCKVAEREFPKNIPALEGDRSQAGEETGDSKGNVCRIEDGIGASDDLADSVCRISG